MSYCLSIKAGSMEVLNGFLREQPSGVSVTSKPTEKPKSKPIMAYDSAEDILQIIVNFSRDLDINLLAAWIVKIITDSNGKKTTINGQQSPITQAELTAMISALIEKQKDQSKNDHS